MLHKYIKLHSKSTTKSDFTSQLSRARLVRMGAYFAIAGMAVYAICFVCPPVRDDASHAITGTPVASDTTLSISLSSNILSLDITPTSSSGTFATTADDDTGASTAVIHVATNNITGYTLGIKASNPASSSADKLISNNEKCENTPTSAKCAINSIPSPTSEADYIDSDNTALNNTWGYLPSKYNSLDNTNYLPAPVAGDTIAVTSGPNPEDTTNNTAKNNTTPLVEDEYTIDYGMRIDYSPYAGTYSTNYNNQSYVITAVGNLVPYSVSYDANKPEQASATANVDNMPTAQAGNVQGGDTIAVLLSPKVPTLGNSNPSTGDYDYAGYVFAGWCTVQPEVPNEINGQPNTQGYQSCPIDTQQPDQARLFQPGDNFGIDQTVDNTQILYAVWGAPARVAFNSNGLTYSDATTATENIMTFIPTYADGKVTSDKVNAVESGIYRTPTLSTPDNYIFKGWSTDQNATEATYADEQAIINDLSLNAGDNIELYAIWNYATVITFNGNGNDAGNTPMADITIEAGQTEALPQNTYTKDGYVFNGWNTVQAPTEQDPGEMYADKANYTAETGSNNITLYAQWKLDVCDPNNICYKPNGADSPTTMNPQSASSSTNITLWASNYKYDTNNDGHNDYGFAGWSEDKDAAAKLADNDSTNNPVVYGPNQTITTGDLSTAGMKLYAVWIAPEENTSFQTFTCPSNTDMPIGTVIALRDNRDSEVYTVAKLVDDNCWMTENLRLDNNATINATNTNNPISSFTALSPSSDSWCTDTLSSCYNQSLLNTNNIASTASPMTTGDANTYSYGNYYNWYSATAGNGTYSKSSGTVSGDLCPTGWHLPYGGNGTSAKGGNTSGGFYYLNEQMGGGTGSAASNNWRSFPNNFIYNGLWDGSLAYYHGNSGSYWSSSASNTNYAYSSGFDNGGMGPGTGKNYKYQGHSVRCVAPVQ